MSFEPLTTQEICQVGKASVLGHNISKTLSRRLKPEELEQLFITLLPCGFGLQARTNRDFKLTLD